MAKNLKIDFETLNATISNYEKSYNQFEEMIKNLSDRVEDLKATGWKSAASTAFFKTYDESWKKNMKTHMIIIEHLKECLDNARSEYEGIYNKIPTLGNDL